MESCNWPQEKNTTRTHEANYGVHIGVYQPCPALKRTLVAMSERTGMSVSQVTDEVLYTGLIEMQELWEGRGGERTGPAHQYIK